MPTVTERFDDIRTRAIARGSFNPVHRGIALVEFMENAIAPDDVLLREAIADAEAALCLIFGLDPNHEWLALMDDLREEPADQQDHARRVNLLSDLARKGQQSMLRQLHVVTRGQAERAVSSLV